MKNIFFHAICLIFAQVEISFYIDFGGDLSKMPFVWMDENNLLVMMIYVSEKLIVI